MLRPRQIKAIEDVRDAYRRKYVAPCLIAATGFGKTHTAVDLIRSAIAKGKKVWFMAHLKEILNDTDNRLNEADIRHGWIAAGKKVDHMANVQLVMIQTIVRRLDRFVAPDLIIVDEAHLCIPKSYQEVFKWAKAGSQHYEKGGSLLLLLTATPTRLDGRGLGEVSDILIPTCSTQELIDEGLLAPIRYFAPVAVDTSSIKTKMGDFANNELSDLMDKPKITGNAVMEYKKVAHGRPTIVFCVSIKHAIHAAEEFSAAGYRAVAISGDSDAEERDNALNGLRNGEIDIVCNCQLYVAGVDAPAVSCIIDLSPTQSVVKYLQRIGRGLRIHPSKTDCIVLDHAGNLARHGDPAMAREWSLDGSEKKKSKSKNEVSIKTCPMCFASVYSIVAECSCGHRFLPKIRDLNEVEGELVEIDTKQIAIQKKIEQGRAQTKDELIALGKARGMKNPYMWANYVLKARESKKMSVA